MGEFGRSHGAGGCRSLSTARYGSHERRSMLRSKCLVTDIMMKMAGHLFVCNVVIIEDFVLESI